MTYSEMLAELERHIDAAGSAKAWAEIVGVSEQTICDIRHGRRMPGPRVLPALGLVKDPPTYRREENTP